MLHLIKETGSEIGVFLLCRRGVSAKSESSLLQSRGIRVGIGQGETRWKKWLKNQSSVRC